ncbi:rod shape-determining protein MreD [Paraliobacillus ryukyuensis]|uniref:Rod shape-determining protein MreD n=1 Tax=Paraliobacillus ryukyuensis TaxID=200904 RepID=A0A366DPR2_9BACI|nr:rod shape-determining protein MreD [Paraliobacillus ryukyuensis]RBO92093.1 rod shape-determining protein MreD [Paraliobacillus ryukyuensis]
MSRLYIPLLLVLIFVFEGVAYEFIPADITQRDLFIIAHWTFVFLVLMALFYDMEYTYYSILAAVIIGLMTDIAYTNIIGVYMFIYALVIYFIHGIRKLLHANFFVAFLLTILGVALVDMGISFVYSFIGVNNMPLTGYMVYRLVPTLIANAIAFIVFYIIFKSRLVKWATVRFDNKK